MNVRAELASRFVDVENLPWEKTRYPGIEQKTLLVDKGSGLLTTLMRMAPGAHLHDHEHVKIEQTYVLEGTLVCPEVECHAGQFVWRPAGSRHDAKADVVQTLIDRKQPERLQHPYARSMMAGLLYPPETTAVLLIGLGGGAFVHFLNRHFAELRLDVVELDPAVVKVARDYFGTAENARTRIFVGDGRDFLQRAAGRYDLILLDAHLHPGGETDKTGHPLSLQTQAFYRGLHER